MALNLSSLLTILLHSGGSQCGGWHQTRTLSCRRRSQCTCSRFHNAGTAAQTARCHDFDLILGQRQVRVTEGTVRVNARIQRGGLAQCAVAYSPSARFDLSSSWKSRLQANRQAGVGLVQSGGWKLPPACPQQSRQWQTRGPVQTSPPTKCPVFSARRRRYAQCRRTGSRSR